MSALTNRYLRDLRGTGRKRDSAGQAFVEFAIVLIILSILVFGAIQYGHMISVWTRMAAVAREGGRAHVALNYGKDDYPTEAITIMKDMIQPGDIEANGAICFSIIRREGSGLDSDKMVIVGQHYFPQTGAPFNSKLGIVGTEVSTNEVPLELVTVSQTVVAVEVMYDFSKDNVTPVNGLLELGNLKEAYELAIF